jgi:hypothetical protein
LLLSLAGARIESSRRAPVERWDAPRLPEVFGGPSEFFDFYAALHRFALQRRLTGLSHVEIAAACPARQAADLAREFERLYYDSRVADPDLGEAHALCGRTLESLKRS